MVQIGNVPEIKAVKRRLEALKDRDLIGNWELPYEEILTRITAAIFFITPTDKSKLSEIWDSLSDYEMLQYRPNEEKKLSQLEWRIEFKENFVL